VFEMVPDPSPTQPEQGRLLLFFSEKQFWVWKPWRTTFHWIPFINKIVLCREVGCDERALQLWEPEALDWLIACLPLASLQSFIMDDPLAIISGGPPNKKVLFFPFCVSWSKTDYGNDLSSGFGKQL
jgi:hypothetical protein